MNKLKRWSAFVLCFCMIANLIVPSAYGAVDMSSFASQTATAGDRATNSNADEKDTGKGGAQEEEEWTASASDAELATAANALKYGYGYFDIEIKNNNEGSRLPLQVGSSYQLEVEITPSGGEEIQPVFESYNPSVAKVDEVTGQITAVSVGYTTIKASITYSDEKYSSSDTIYIGVIEESPILVTYYANGGTFEDSTTVKQIYFDPNDYISYLSVKNGDKALRGWYSDAECTQLVTEGDSITLTEDTDLYAGWVDTNTITFDFGGYSDGRYTQREYEIGEGMKISGHYPSMPDKPVESVGDKMFAGWMTPDGTLYPDRDISNYRPAGNETIVAQWVDYYTITYDYDGVRYNGGVTSTEFVLPGNRLNHRPYLPDGPSDDTNDKMFNGWKNAEGKIYSNNDLWYYYPARSETLKAQWAGYHKITFDYNGLEKPSETKNVVEGDTISAPYISSDPAETGGKVFAGWKIPSGQILIGYEISGYIPAEDETIVAQWGDYYTVKFDYGGVTYNKKTEETHQVIRGNQLESNRAYMSNNPDETEGRMFIGWKNESGTVISSSDIQYYVPAGNETLTAQWLDDYYTMTFDYNGVTYDKKTLSTIYVRPGSNISNYPSLSSDTDITKTDGKLFKGWEISGRLLTNNEVYNYIPEKDETFTAQWAEKYITVTFDYNGVKYDNKTVDIKNVIPGSIINSVPYFSSNPSNMQGKLLEGWELDGVFYTSDEVRMLVPEKDMTFTARWTSNYYTVRLDYNGIKYNGKLYEETYVIPGGTINRTPGIPTKPYQAYNKIFLGWQDSKGNLYSNDEVRNYSPSGNETLFARWADYVTVTYDANGGKMNGSSTVKYVPVGEAVPYNPGPAKTGYKFDGWYEKDTGRRVPDRNYAPSGDVTLVAGWKEFYTITYDANGGTYIYDSGRKEEVIKGAAVYLNGDSGYKKDGYSLAGWCEDKECAGPVLTGYYTPKADVTLYAKWESYYTITFDPGVGAISDRTTKIIKGERMGSKLSTPYNKNAIFGGWYRDKEFTQAVTRAYVPTSDETFYAKWIEETYDVTFHAGGAWIYDSAIRKYVPEITWGAEAGQPLSQSYISSSRTGYTCTWYMDENFKTPFNWETAIESDLDLYAAWTKNVTVFWDADGGMGTSNSKETHGSFTVAQGDSYYLPDVAKEGYAFVKWVDDTGKEVTRKTKFYADTYIKAVWEAGYRVTLDLQGGELYDGGGSYKTVFYVRKGSSCGYTLAPAKSGAAFAGWKDEAGKDIGRIFSYIPVKDTVLKAQWTDEYNMVRFHVGAGEPFYNDGDYAELLEERVPKNKTYYEVMGTTPSKPKLKGKVCTGWSLTEGGTEVIDLMTYRFTKDADLYPVWKDCWYISVELMGGYYYTNRDQHNLGYSVAKGEPLDEVGIMPKNLSKEGYTFSGWYDNADLTGKVYEIPFTPTGNMTLYAKWTEGDIKKYTVSFDTAGGNTIESQKIGEGSKASRPENPEKEGSIFDGWYRDSEYKYLYYFTDPVYKDITLYAKWITTTDVKDATILVTGEYTYTGELIVPEITVKMGSRTLEKGTDYTVTGGGTDAGKATVTVTGQNEYTGSREVTFTIKKAPTEAKVPEGPFEFIYGQKLKDTALTGGWNWQNPESSVGSVGNRRTGIVFKAADANHEDLVAQVEITVNPKSIDGAVITLENTSGLAYDGEEKRPEIVSVKLNGENLPAGAYEIAYTDNIDPGTATVTITGKGNYVGTASATFTIEKGDPSPIVVNQVYNVVYGNPLSSANPALPEGWTWQNPSADVGGASQTNKTFKADYKAPAGSKYKDKNGVDLKVHVIPREIKSGDVKLEDPPYIFKDSPVEPKVTVTCGGVALKQDEDYTLVYEGNEQPGNAAAIVTGQGNYSGTVKKTFKIIMDPLDIASADIIVSPAVETYTGKAIEPSVTVRIDPKTLIKDTDYTVSYDHNIEPGQADVKVTGKGEYHGSQTVHFFIIPENYELTAIYGDKLDAVTLPGGWKWKNPEAYVGDATEEGRYFTAVYTGDGITKDAEFKVKVRPKNIENETVIVSIDRENLVYDGTELKPEITIRDEALGTVLVPDKDYTVTYSNNTDAGDAGVEIQGINNYSGIIQDGFTIEQADPKPTVESDKIEEHKIHLTIREEPFFLMVMSQSDGEISFISGDENVFTVEKKENEDGETDGFLTVTGLGEATLTIEIPETKNYKSAKLIYNVEVVPVMIQNSDIKLEKTSYTYTGEQIRPKFTVVTETDTLTEGTDYTASYGTNVKAGRNAGSVTVTGKGDYAGTASVSFTIDKAENPAELPEEVQAVYGQKLEEIGLTGGWKWKTPQDYVGNVGKRTHAVVLETTDNYLEKSGTADVAVSEKSLDASMFELEYAQTEYSGTGKRPSVAADDNGLLTADDYTVNYSGNTELGKAAVTITGKGNYTGTVELSFMIIAASLKDTDAVVTESFVYDGKAKTPEPVVKSGGKLLVRGIDYEVTYKDNVNAGVAQAVVTGKGNYQGLVTTLFTIKQAEPVIATPSDLKSVYGSRLKDVKLPENYTWTADEESYVGNAGVQAFAARYTSPDKNYKNKDVTLTVTVEKRTLKAEDFSLVTETYVYDGTAKKPPVKALTEYLKETDYKVSYEDNTGAGTAHAAVTGTGNCEGTVKLAYTIKKATPHISVDAGTEITRYITDGDLQLNARISNDGKLTYTSKDPAVAAVDETGTVKPVTAGTVVITVAYAGDDNYNAVQAEVNITWKRRSGGGSSGGSSGGGGGSAIKTSATYNCVPEGYTGATKVIGNAVVPEYVTEGTWQQETDGRWKFTDKAGAACAGIWVPAYNPYADSSKGQSAFNWFLFDKNGHMITGWYTDENGNTFYLNPVSDNTLGSMATGWKLIDGKYYYFNNVADGTRGRLLRNTRTPDGYYVNADGVWVE